MARTLLLSVLLLSGCYRFRGAPLPMASLEDPSPGGKARCLLVLLPGIADRAGTFRDKGFVRAIQEKNLSVDIVSADALYGYYIQNIFPQRLEEDVIAPARARGYEQIWLLGISMGGFGTFLYTQQYPDHVDGIAALAPFQGDVGTLQEIRDSGGLAKWQPPRIAPIDANNYTAQVWGWLHRVTGGQQPGPSIYLGYGEDDQRVGKPVLLQGALPPDHVFRTPGGHDWGPWRNLLEQFLTRSDFKDRCGR